MNSSKKTEGVLKVLREISHIVRQGENISVACPLAPYTDKHKSDRDSSPSMGILVREGQPCLVNCFTCGFRAGNLTYLIKTLARYDRQKYSHLVPIVLKLEEIDYSLFVNQIPSYSDIAVKKREEAAKIVTIPEDSLGDRARKYTPYLKERGITLETAKRWESGFDREARRVIFPVRSSKGELLGAIGRKIKKEVHGPKYYEYFDFNKIKTLFGSHLYVPGNSLIIVEGLFDAILTDQALNYGLEGYSVVAILGSKITDWQVSKIISLAPEVILAFDNDEVGLACTKKTQEKMGKRVCTTIIKWREHDTDPASMNPFELEDLIRDPSFIF